MTLPHSPLYTMPLLQAPLYTMPLLHSPLYCTRLDSTCGFPGSMSTRHPPRAAGCQPGATDPSPVRVCSVVRPFGVKRAYPLPARRHRPNPQCAAFRGPTVLLHGVQHVNPPRDGNVVSWAARVPAIRQEQQDRVTRQGMAMWFPGQHEYPPSAKSSRMPANCTGSLLYCTLHPLLHSPHYATDSTPLHTPRDSTPLYSTVHSTPY